MSMVPLLVGVAATAVAAVAAAGDGAVVAADGDAEPPGPAGALASERELTRRTFVFGRICAYLVAGAAFASALELGARPTGVAVIVAVLGIALPLAVVEAGARAIGEAMGDRLLRGLGPLLLATRRLFTPVAAVFEQLDSALLAGLPPAPPPEVVREETAEQFRQVVAAEPQVTGHVRTLLEGVFSLDDTEVRDVMVPRVDIVGVEIETPWSEVLDRVRSSGHARLPVYEETLDEVRGILYAKDLLGAALEGAEPEGGWRTLVRPAEFIPTTKPLDDQLRDFQATRSHLAIVVDEFGGTAGLVTIEDILEQIVGEIHDERDEAEEADIVAREGRRFWVSGRVTLDELASVTEHEFDEEGVSTVSGLIYARLGRPPRAGETLALDGFRVVVEKVVGRRIRRVYFERVESLAGREAE